MGQPGKVGDFSTPREHLQLDAGNVFLSLSYGPKSHQKLDLYVPNFQERHKVLLWAHGGAWTGGSRNELPSYLKGLVSQGWAVASVSYQLGSPGSPSWPENVHDYKLATRWLRLHANTFSLDGNFVVAAGTSAGGHLAALAANTAGRQQEPTAMSASLAAQRPDYQGVLSFVGPLDLQHFYETGNPFWTAGTSTMLGCATNCAPEVVALASPLSHIHVSSPPHYLVYGLRDDVVDAREINALHQKWQSVFGGRLDERLQVELVDGTHGFVLGDVDMRGATSFLQRISFPRSP